MNVYGQTLKIVYQPFHGVALAWSSLLFSDLNSLEIFRLTICIIFLWFTWSDILRNHWRLKGDKRTVTVATASSETCYSSTQRKCNRSCVQLTPILLSYHRTLDEGISWYFVLFRSLVVMSFHNAPVIMLPCISHMMQSVESMGTNSY